MFLVVFVANKCLGVIGFPAMIICEQAETFRLLLLMGVVEKSEIISWADGIIGACESAPEWLLDVSLAESEGADVIEAKLRDLPGEWGQLAAAYAALDRFAKEFQVNDKFTSAEAAHMLEVWAYSAKLKQDDWTAAMLPSWIASEIAHGHATEQQVVESIDRCIAHFAAIRKGG